MDKNKKSQGEMIKNVAVIGTVTLVTLIVMFSSVLFLKSRIADENINQEELIGDTYEHQEFESASTEIGKTVEEAKNEVEESQMQNSAKSNSIEEQKEDEADKEKNKTQSENKIASTKKQEQNNEKEEESNKNENKQVKFQTPIKGEIIREFASDSLVYSDTLQEWITHKGVDIKADKTAVVVASCDGTVESIKTDPRYGLTVIISHEEGYKTVYSNLLTAEFVVQGENVTAGQTIGTVGNSASFEISDPYHLHFGVLKDGENQDPMMCIN